jgi:hypothetical protein
VRQTKFAGDDRPSAALVRGVDETGHWEHETMTTADFDPAAWTWAEEQRRRFLSRAR